MSKAKNIGIEVKPPKKECTDRLCPFHGSIKIRGRTFVGEVVSAKMPKTVTVLFGRKHYLPKYERYEKRTTRLKAHNPICIDSREGDIVKMAETKPISKTKSFVVVGKLGVVKGFEEKMRALEESKVPEKEPKKAKSEEGK